MKKIVFFLLFVNVIVFAQAPPQGISHRGTVYNASNVLMPNTAVKIRVSILDNSATGTFIYKEIHSKTTNAQGQYSLNIGEGANPTSAFSSINWGLNLKFLKVEIDLTNTATISSPDSSFAVVGSNQLMSVPYAIFALNSQIKVYNTITDLRAATGITNEIAYIKGHTTAGDGGEGTFIWRALPTGNPNLYDNNGTIVRDNAVASGWVRIIQDRINVKFFGINFNDPSQDHGIQIQKAIDYATRNSLNYLIIGDNKVRDYTNCGSVVYVPAGTYKIKGTLTLKYGVSIEGDGRASTVLKADNSISAGGTMIEIDGGQILGVNISNMSFDGNASVGNPASTNLTDAKNCFYIKAHQQTPTDTFNNTGGLWGDNFKNIDIKNFNGSGIILEGNGINSQSAPEDYRYPNQGIIFENIFIARQRDISDCLLIRGETGQLTFINCGFDGYTNNYRASKLFNVAIETNGVEAAVIKFLTCTFQNSEYGVFIKYAESVSFDNCWFETLDVGVCATTTQNLNASKCINILNSRFANAAGFGTIPITNKNSSGGSCIIVEGGSNVNVQNNYVLTSVETYNNNIANNYFIKNNALDSKINASNNSFQNASLGRTFGIANRTTSISGNTLNTFGYKFVTVNCVPTTNTTNNIQEIKSEISAGEMITICATGTGQIKFENTKNIIFAKSTTTSFVLLPKETATFMKIDNGIGPINSVYYNETYQLISVNKIY